MQTLDAIFFQFFSTYCPFNLTAFQTKQISLPMIKTILVVSVEDRFFLSSSSVDFDVHLKFILAFFSFFKSKPEKNLTGCTSV